MTHRSFFLSLPFRTVVRAGSYALLSLALVVSVCMPRSAMAQADTGRIKGTVTDASGALVVGAKVVATKNGTGATLEATTGKDGVYGFPQVQAGFYTITVEAPGFSTASVTDNELDDGSALTINVTMQVGKEEQVIVTATEGETVNTTTGEVSHVIDGETVRDLALNGRNYLDLLGTLPGSVVTSLGDAISTTISGSTTGTTLNGARATANGLYLDGVPNKDIGANDHQFNNVGIDFVEHVKVQTSSASAQFGGQGGPTINVVTRSGTNTIHGSIFEYIRNNKVDATNWFLHKFTYAPDGVTIIGNSPISQHLRFNDFGAAVGGPILKNKLFFFAGTEWKLIAQQAAPTFQTIPGLAQLNGDFTNYTTATPTCTLTTGYATKVLGLSSALPCNIASRITPFGKALQNVYLNTIIPASATYNPINLSAALTGGNGDITFTLPQPYRNHQYLARLDFVINSRQNMFARWIADTHTTTSLDGDGTLPTTPYHDEGPANNVAIGHTFVVTPSAINEISFSALWSAVNQQPYGNAWLRSTYGFSYTPLYPTYPGKIGIPTVGILDQTGFDSQAYLNFSHTTYMQAQDIVTKVWGKHQTKFGALEGRYRKDQNGNPRADLGSFSFSTTATNTTGNPIADALLGNFYTYTESGSDVKGFFRLWNTAAFFDDVWRALPKLSINYGLRYEYMTPWVSDQNNVAAFYPDQYNPASAVTVNPDGTVVPGSGDPYNGIRRAVGGVPANQVSRVPGATSAAVLAVPATAPRGFYNAQNTFAPRVGLAYDIYGDGRTAIRMGAGLFYDTPQGNVAYSALDAPPYLPSVEVYNGNADAISSTASTNQYTLQDFYSIDPKLQRSYVYQYNIGVQQQLAAGMFLNLNYIGSESRHLLRNPDINGVDPYKEDCLANNNPLISGTPTVNYMRSVTNAQAAALQCAAPQNSPYYPGGAYSGGAYAGYGAIYQYRTDVDANYNALQMNINRRVGKGRFTFAYTWSKALTTASSDTAVQHYLIYSKTYYYGPASFDRRNVVSATYIAQTPPLARRNIVLREAFGSWMLTGTARYQGGTYSTPTYTDSYGATGLGAWAGLPVKYGGHPWNWWYTENPGAIVNFSAPAYETQGNTPIGIVVGPHLVNVDESLRKTFALTERYRLTAQFDAFNIFNHPNFAAPSVNLNTPTTVKINGVTDSAYEGILSAGRPRNIQAALRLTF